MGLRRLLRNRSGAAAAEMALILPGIAFILLNVVDIGTYIFIKMQVDLAAHEAVGAARVLCSTAAQLPTSACTGRDAAMTAAAQSTTLGTSVTIANTADGYYCADSSGTLVSVTSTTTTCTGTVSGSTSAPGIYIRTTASKAFTPVFPGASVASLLTSPITRTAWLRLK